MALTAAELAETTRILKQALEGSLRSVLNVRGGSAGIAGGGSRDAKAVSAASRENVQRLEKSSEKLDTFSKRTITANEGLKTFSSRMVSVDKIIRQLNGELQEYKKRIGSTKPQVVTFDFSGLTQSTDNTVATFDKLTTSTGLVKDAFSLLKSTIVDVERKVDDFGNKLESNVGRISLVPPIGPINVNPITVTVPPPTVTFAGLDFGALNTAFDDLGKKLKTDTIPSFTNLRSIVGPVRLSLMFFKTALDGLTTSLNTLGTSATSPMPGLITNFIKASARLGTFTSQLTKATVALRTLNRGGDSGRGDRGSSDSPPESDREKKIAADKAASKEFWASMKSLGLDLWTAIKRMADDAFGTLAARGYGTTDSLAGLYVDAAKAGMSLKEYAQLMDKNMIAVSRASGFADFQTQLKHGTDGLKKFGVFGQDANQLAGTMMATAVGMGVPQNRLNKAVDAQTEAFGELRKGSNLTAEAFQQLIATIQDDEQLQRELSNLSVDERISRTKDITLGLGYAKQLGLSESAQRAYTQSVLEHRKTTVKQRFEQAGRISQAGAMVGMSAEDTDRMRILSKNKYRTAAEDKEFAMLAGKMNSGIEKMQQGGPGSQFQADIIREKLEQAGLGSALAAGTQIKSATEAGDTKNKDLNKTLGPFAQFLGESITTLGGIMKNPLAQVVATGAAQLAATFWSTKSIVAAIWGASGGAGGPGGVLGKLGPLLKIAGTVALVAGVAYQGYNAYQNYQKAKEDEKEGKEGAKENKGEAIGTGVGIALGAAVAGAITFFTGGIGAAVAVPIVAAVAGLGGLLGGWIGKKASAETATEKNTRELENNRKALEKNTRATAGSTVVGTDNLASLTQNVAQTSMAFTAKTAEENKADFESKKSPEQKAAEKAEKQKEYDYLNAPANASGDPRWKVLGVAKPEDPSKANTTNPVVETPKVEVKSTPQGKPSFSLFNNSDGSALASTASSKPEDPSKANTTNPVVETPKVEVKSTPQGKPSFSLFNNSDGSALASTASSKPSFSIFGNKDSNNSIKTAAQISKAVIATPTPPTTQNIGPTPDINKETPKKEEAKSTETTSTTSLQPNPVADTSQILLQILDVLRNSLTAEMTQAELTEKLLRASALKPFLPDTQEMATRVFAQA